MQGDNGKKKNNNNTCYLLDSLGNYHIISTFILKLYNNKQRKHLCAF